MQEAKIVSTQDNRASVIQSQLIHHSRQALTGVEPLPLGTVCLDHEKAASVRDDLADKNARVASLEAHLATNWPVVVVVAVVGVVLAGTAAGVGYYAGTQAKR